MLAYLVSSIHFCKNRSASCWSFPTLSMTVVANAIYPMCLLYVIKETDLSQSLQVDDCLPCLAIVKSNYINLFSFFVLRAFLHWMGLSSLLQLFVFKTILYLNRVQRKCSMCWLCETIILYRIICWRRVGSLMSLAFLRPFPWKASVS